MLVLRLLCGRCGAGGSGGCCETRSGGFWPKTFFSPPPLSARQKYHPVTAVVITWPRNRPVWGGGYIPRYTFTSCNIRATLVYIPVVYIIILFGRDVFFFFIFLLFFFRVPHIYHNIIIPTIYYYLGRSRYCEHGNCSAIRTSRFVAGSMWGYIYVAYCGRYDVLTRCNVRPVVMIAAERK